MPSSHGCAQGKDVWTLITNDIDHEKIHTAQVLEARYESRMTASPMERLVAEWLAERARFIGSLIGLTDEQFNARHRAWPVDLSGGGQARADGGARLAEDDGGGPAGARRCRDGSP